LGVIAWGNFEFYPHFALIIRASTEETLRNIAGSFRMLHFMNDLATLGQRMRHFRTAAGLTLEQLGSDVGIAASQLSLMENGKREPRLSLLAAIAERVGVTVPELLEPEAPSERAGLEIELERAQSGAVYAELGLPQVRPGKGMSDETL